jgi:beta-galactosidase
MNSAFARFLLGCVFGFLLHSARADEAPPRERIPFNAGWRFHPGDPAGVVPGSLDYSALKPWILPSAASVLPGARSRPPGDAPGTNLAVTGPDFADSAWRSLDLPHDWGIEGPFSFSHPNHTGRLPWWGVAWYRKTFDLPATDSGRRLTLEIDGAMSHSTVWLNGHLVGGWPYGYSSFQLDLTPYARPGAANTLAIRLDNPKESSRWYPGGGIYRNVWLTKTNPVRIGQWGVFVTTPRITPDAASVAVRVELENLTASATEISVETELHFAGRRVATTGPAPLSVSASGRAVASATAEIRRPKLWDLATPHLYTAVTFVRAGKRLLDRHETPFGIRTIEFAADRGFLLNGRVVELNGVCNHHDLGALGAAFNVRAAERQLEILQSMGVNALRTSHNPPAPELLDLCDRRGILVIAEAFDCWKVNKKKGDYGNLWDDWHEADLRALILRDRNHPSVILWSIGNEILELRRPEGPALAASLSTIVRALDTTRPTTLGSNFGDASYNGIQLGVDVMGQNYQYGGYARFRRENPSIPLVGSETSSTVSTRGEYFFPVDENKAKGRFDFQVSSYDLYGPGWAFTPDNEFKAQDQVPAVAGEFVWTGFDYLGEPTPYNGDTTNLLNFNDAAGQARMAAELKELGKIRPPSRSSYFGIVDLAGFPKDRFYLYQARWRPDLPMAHLLPHWTWPGREGELTPVHVYTSGDEAELFLNGQSLGRKKRGPFDYRLRWNEVHYQPGELKVVAYKNGARWATDIQRTAGAPARIELSVDRARLRADGADLAFVTARILDATGTLVPRAATALTFSATGPGAIVATDNGDPTSFESFQSPARRAFNGLAIAIVRPAAGPGGRLTITATAEGLPPAKLRLSTK